MANLQEIQARVEDLTRRHNAASLKQGRLQGVLEEKKLELKRLKQEIEEAGFNPKTLREEKDRLEKELEQLLSKFDTELRVVEEAQNEYEK